jgi:hypothetical protein
MEDEYIRKTEILKNLIDTLSWPAGSIQDNTLNICLWGTSQESKPFFSLDGTQSKHYHIRIRESKTLSDTSKNCQIVLVSKNQKSQAQKIIQQHAKKPVLLLGDIENFARDGGSMNFMNFNKGLALSVNLETIKASNLKLDLKAYSEITLFPDQKDLDK